jgi:hypothetical protein
MPIQCPGCHEPLTYLRYKVVDERVYTVKLNKENRLQIPARKCSDSLISREYYTCPLCLLIISRTYRGATQFLKGKEVISNVS